MKDRKSLSSVMPGTGPSILCLAGKTWTNGVDFVLQGELRTGREVRGSQKAGQPQMLSQTQAQKEEM